MSKHTQALKKAVYDSAVSEGEFESKFIYFRIPAKGIEATADIEQMRALIAAAPDLLEALRLLEKGWAEKDLSYGYEYKLQKAIAAIAKATGGAE